MFYEDRVSSRSYVEDEVMSSNSPLIFCGVLGSAKKYSKFVVPFAWYEVVQGGCDRCYDDERYLERQLFIDREIEIFTLSRSYNCLLYTSRCV